jgi:hypothetical protein
MGRLTDWLGDFDVGEALGVGLDNRQLSHLAGALFLALFALLALRRASRASGVVPALWLALAVGLVAVAARGFPDQVPDGLRPWAEPDRLAQAAAVLILLGFSVILVSAPRARRPLPRLVYRLGGIAVAGVALWLASGWFGDAVPEEIRPWAARTTVTRLVVVSALLCLALTFWFRPSGEAPHVQWANRALTPISLAFAAGLTTRWFGPAVSSDLSIAEVTRVVVIVAAVATGTCVTIAGGAYLLRERPAPEAERSKAAVRAAVPQPRRLPVATLLDEHGRPIAAPSAAANSQAGAAGG